MKNRIIILTIVMLILNTFFAIAATLDPTIPVPYNITLTEDGFVSWKADKSTSITYNKFQIRLIKRSIESTTETTTNYKWTETGSIKNVSGDERSADINIGSAGTYRVRVRAVNADGNYSNWGESTVDISVSKDSAGNVNIYGGYNWGSYQAGPNGNTNNNQATNLYIGSDGSLQYSSNTNVNQNQTTTNGFNIYNKNQFNQQIQNQNPVVTEQVGPGTNLNNNNQGPAAQNNIEVGWHVDSRGRYYNQGNGSYLSNTWGLIDGKYYRFNNQGYALVYTWFKDTQNNSWYYLGQDGEMYTGWQNISGKWYYLNPTRGTGYGVMYENTIVNIDGKYYAFQSDGSLVINAWFNGRYYGADGSQV